jgi:hypothetical protein
MNHRKQLVGRSGAAALALAAILTLGLAPTFASAAASDHGATFRCGFKSIVVGGNSGMRLKRFVVTSPTELYGREPNQQVGFQLIVQRRYDDTGWTGKWKPVHKSAIQRSIATPSTPADFEGLQLIAKIGYVDSIDRWPDGNHTEFRTVLRFFWFFDNGSIQKQRYVGGTYHSYRDGTYVWDEHGQCEGLWLDA